MLQLLCTTDQCNGLYSPCLSQYNLHSFLPYSPLFAMCAGSLPAIVFAATGSEVSLAIDVAKALAEKHITANVRHLIAAVIRV